MGTPCLYSPYQSLKRGTIPRIYARPDVQHWKKMMQKAREQELYELELKYWRNMEFVARQINQQVLESATDRYYKKGFYAV